MTSDAPRILFIPVSAPRGVGEYARACEMANAVVRRWPAARVHFVLNKMAPYAASVTFPTTWLPSSATFHPREVCALIRDFRPTLVIFDNAGRTSMLRAAHRVGASIVYVSSRPRQRRRAFRLRWMHLLDEHWIAYPEFIAGALSPVERLKLASMRRPVLRYMDTILPEIPPAEAAAQLARFGLQSENYVLVVPGGGTGHPGAERGPEIMADAAVKLAKHGYITLFVGGSSVVRPSEISLLQTVPRLSMTELIPLIQHARIVITNGGDTLLQALACSRVCIAAAIAHDQSARIDRCEAAGLVIGSELEAVALERAALSLLSDEQKRSDQLALIARHPVTNGMGTALEAIRKLVQA